MERKRRLIKYCQGVYEITNRKSSVSLVTEKLKELGDQEFVIRIPIGGKHNG